MKDNALIIMALGLILLGYTAYDLSKEKTEVRVPISADEAMEILKTDESARDFIREYLANESMRITRRALVWDEESSSFVWDIELMERACGCKVGSEEGLNVLTARIDPVSGEIYNLTTRVGVQEEVLGRERCMEGCHSKTEPKFSLNIPANFTG